MSNCIFLKKFERFSDAKKNGINSSTEYSNNIIATAILTTKALDKKILNDKDRIEMIYQWCPDSTYGYNSTNHHGLEEAKQTYKDIMRKYGVALENNYSQGSIVKQK